MPVSSTVITSSSSKESDASNGDMVVALIDDSATVKTFYKENGHIRLQPENDTMDQS